MPRGSDSDTCQYYATWHDDSLTHGNFLIFLKKFKKKVKNNKKIQKIEELTRGTLSNGVSLDLTGRTNVRRFNQKGTILRLLKIWVPF